MEIEVAFRDYQDAMVKHVAYFCGDETAAMDAVSHAFTQAWIRKDMLEAMPSAAMRAWLYAAARNAAVDIKRRERRFAPMPDYDLPNAVVWDPIDRLTAADLVRLLPPDLAIPIHMKYWQGMNATEIGTAMGIPPATIRTRLRTALRVMRKEMEREGD